MDEYITKDGSRQLKQELELLKSEKRREIAIWLREAAQQGDLTENAEYVEAKEAQTALENRIEEIERRLRSAKVVDGVSGGDQVAIGATIELTGTSAKKGLVVRLAGSEGADVTAGTISASSPMGQALLGKKVGEAVEVETPKGVKKYKVVRIA